MYFSLFGLETPTLLPNLLFSEHCFDFWSWFEGVIHALKLSLLKKYPKASKKAQIYFNLFGSPWEFVTPSDHCGSPFSFFPLSYRGRAVSSSTVSAGCWWDFHLSTFCRFFYDGGRGLHQSVDIFSPILSTILSLAASINRVGRKGRVAAM